MTFAEFLAELQGPKVMGEMSLSSRWLVRIGWKHAILEAIKVAEDGGAHPMVAIRLKELLP